MADDPRSRARLNARAAPPPGEQKPTPRPEKRAPSGKEETKCEGPGTPPAATPTPRKAGGDGRGMGEAKAESTKEDGPSSASASGRSGAFPSFANPPTLNTLRLSGDTGPSLGTLSTPSEGVPPASRQASSDMPARPPLIELADKSKARGVAASIRSPMDMPPAQERGSNGSNGSNINVTNPLCSDRNANTTANADGRPLAKLAEGGGTEQERRGSGGGAPRVSVDQIEIVTGENAENPSDPTPPDKRSEDWKERHQRLKNMHHNPGQWSSEKLPPSPSKRGAMKKLHKKTQRRKSNKKYALSPSKSPPHKAFKDDWASIVGSCCACSCFGLVGSSSASDAARTTKTDPHGASRRFSVNN